MIRSPENAAWILDYVDPIHADSEVRLNMICLKDSLMLSLSSLYTLDLIPTFVDSGSSHCFIDSAFVLGHELPVSDVTPKRLHLFDGTYGTTITQETDLPVKFPSGETLSIRFLVTPLDPSCSTVLGYDWLAHHNLLVDWATSSITFQAPVQDSSVLLSTSPPQDRTFDSSATSPLFPLETLLPPTSETPPIIDIKLVNAVAFMRSVKAEGLQVVSLRFTPNDFASGRSTSVSPEETPIPNLKRLPEEFHEFKNIFSKKEATNLPRHCLATTRSISSLVQPLRLVRYTPCPFMSKRL